MNDLTAIDLRERTVDDDDGQLLTGSYMDYAMPRADDAPLFVHEFHSVPATTNPDWCEGPAARPDAPARCPRWMNALVDALSKSGIRLIDMPATPERVSGVPFRQPAPSNRIALRPLAQGSDGSQAALYDLH
jgi:CO/xanthine dehydrogenase Mo-binding subunit